MFSVPIVKWSDDVSGSKSKQYNPHTNVYVANASLPHRKLAQEYFGRAARHSCALPRRHHMRRRLNSWRCYQK
jgi:hypothetical protein